MRRHYAALGTFFVLAVPLAALAQSPAPDADELGSISGRVTDARTGEPVAGADVRLSGRNAPRQPAVTDAEGRYRFEGVQPRRYGIRIADQPFHHSRNVTVGPGAELESIDLEISPPASISGFVTDDQGEPLEGIDLSLYRPEYFLGEVQYYKKDAARTDDQGVYRFERGVRAGKSYLIRARDPNYSLAAVSDEPQNPEARRHALIPTYYPGAPVAQEAAPVVVRPGEQREGVDIRMLSTPSLCAEATVEFADAAADARFWIRTAEPAAGMGPLGGTTSMPNGGPLGTDGNLRICGLHPAEYRLTVLTGNVNTPQSLGALVFSVTDRDVTGLVVTARKTMPVSGRFEWAGEPPEETPEARGLIALRPRHRGFGGGPSATALVPGEFQLRITDRQTGEEYDPLIDEYYVQAVVRQSSIYVKDVLYGGESVLHRPLVLGSAIGDAQLRVLLGHDGGTFRVRAVNADGEPASNANIYFVAASARSPMDVADNHLPQSADQNGELQSQTFEPGVYSIVATYEDLYDRGPDTMERLWNLRRDGTAVTLDPNAEKELTVPLVEEE